MFCRCFFLERGESGGGGERAKEVTVSFFFFPLRRRPSERRSSEERARFPLLSLSSRSLSTHCWPLISSANAQSRVFWERATRRGRNWKQKGRDQARRKRESEEESRFFFFAAATNDDNDDDRKLCIHSPSRSPSCPCPGRRPARPRRRSARRAGGRWSAWRPRRREHLFRRLRERERG